MRLRPATPGDVALLRHWDAQPHVIAAVSNDDWQWETEVLRTPSWRQSLIGEVDGRPVGFLEIIDPALEVRADWRGSGIARRVLDAAVGTAQSRGAAGLWSSARARALGFYERAGWTAVGPEWIKPGVGPTGGWSSDMRERRDPTPRWAGGGRSSGSVRGRPISGKGDRGGGMAVRLGLGSGTWALAAILVVTTLAGGPPGTAGAASALEGGWSPSAAQPYSDPIWMPVRQSVRVACAKSNCDGPYHGYWAIDFVGQRDAPLYAAGAGIAHVGATGVGCPAPGEPVTKGNWIWIDHGGGVVTRYHHLNRVRVTEGQLVTPGTVIGTMGGSGYTSPCRLSYLHFEVVTGGVSGTRVNPGALAGCVAGRRVSFPSFWGVTSWNSLVRDESHTPDLDGSCVPGTSPVTPSPVQLSAIPGGGSVTLRWQPPTDGSVNGYTITQETYWRRKGIWHALRYHSVESATGTATIAGLTNGWTYRFRVAAHSQAAYSSWTEPVQATPALAPLAPLTGRILNPRSTSIRFGWWRSTKRGTPVTTYRVAIRRKMATRWTRWSYTTIPGTLVSYKWTGLRPGRTYQMKVRANSAMGRSVWGKKRSLRTLRG